MKRAWSIRIQLLVALIPLLVLIRLISGVIVLQLTKDAITRAYDGSLDNSASAIAAHVLSTPTGYTFSLPALAENMLRSSEQDTIYYQVLDAKGRVIGRNAALPPRLGTGAASYETVDWNGHSLRYVSRTYYLDPSDPSSDKITVQVAETMQRRAESTEESTFYLLIQQFVTLCNRGSNRLARCWPEHKANHKIQREIEQRSGYDFRPVEVETAPSEIRPLIDTINSLLERVGADVDAQRRFAANAAHQLRTPLAGVRAHAEVAMSASSLDDARESIEQLLDGTDRCTHLVKQLLAISRVEPGAQENIAFSNLDLTEIAKECCRLQLSSANKKAIDLGYEGAEGLMLISGNRTCLQEMLINLIDNAIRYSPSGSTVTVRVTEGPSGMSLIVEDNGPGIPIAEQQRVFERFYRLLGTGQEGTGLGLAIVKEVASLHNATVELSSLPGGSGLVVTIVFPKVVRAASSAKGFSA